MLFSAGNCRDPHQHFLFSIFLLFLRFSYHGNHSWSIKSNHIQRRLACKNRSKCKMLLKSHQLLSRTADVTKVKVWNESEGFVDTCWADGRFKETPGLQNIGRRVKCDLRREDFKRSNKISGVIRMGRTSMNGRVISTERGSMFDPAVSGW